MPGALTVPLRRAPWLLLAASLAIAPRAHAQSDEQLARARNEFREAIALQAAGNFAGALAKLQAVAAVRTTPQVRFNIAVCEKQLGKLVTALGNFTLAESEALDQGLAEVAAKAGEHIRDIASRIPKLTIVRGEGAETASIALDGVSLGAAVIGTEMNVDPGPHTIVASIDGEARFSTTVALVEQASERIVIRIERAESAPIVREESPATVSSASSDDLPREGGWSKRHTAWTALGVGGASTAAGVVFLVLRSGAIRDLDAVCRDGHCPPSAEGIADNGKLYSGLAGASFVVGAAGLAIGSVMLFGGSGEGEDDDSRDISSAPKKRDLALTLGAPGASLGAGFMGRF